MPIPAVKTNYTEPLLMKVAQMEERVLGEETLNAVTLEVNQSMRKRSLDERLIELEKNEEIETRLNQIKQGKNHDG
jgi:phage shock protein A